MASSITIFPDQNAGPVPAIFRPSVMYGNSTPTEIGMFQAIPGAQGLVRLGAGYQGTDFIGATDSTIWATRIRAYCQDQSVRDAISRGTAVLEIAGMPRFLSSSSDTSNISASGVSVYRTAKAADLNALQTAMQTLVGIFMNENGFPAPRNPQTGAVEIGRPGVLFEVYNETSSEHFWGWEGVAVGKDYFDFFRRVFLGARAANVNAVIAGPSPVAYNDIRTDKLWASSSADINVSARNAGGTEGTGRFVGFPIRSYWKFDASRIGPGVTGVSLRTNNTFASGTITSDAWSFRPYNTNGQGDPDGDAVGTAYTRTGSGTAYVSADTNWRTTGVKTIALGATAVTHLGAARDASANYTVCVTMDGEGSGADRFAVPFGYNDATRTNKPYLLVTYNQSWVQQFLAYCAANSCPPDAVIIHNFQTTPSQYVQEGFDHVRAALIANGLSASTPVIETEFQNNGGPAGVRDTYRSAAYFIGSVHAHAASGYAGICMASLIKQSTAPVSPNLLYPATPGFEGSVDNWGMITNGTQNGGYFVPVASFLAMRLFGLWANGRQIAASATQVPSIAYRQMAFRSGDTAIVAFSRWSPGSGTETHSVLPSLVTPTRYVSEIRLRRFSQTENDPARVFELQRTSGTGTYASWCQAAATAGADTTYTRIASRFAALTLADVDSGFLEFDIADLPPTPRGTLLNRVQDGQVSGGVWSESAPHVASQGASLVGLIFGGLPSTPIVLKSATLRVQLVADTPGMVLMFYVRFGATSPLWSTQAPPVSVGEMPALSAGLAATVVISAPGTFLFDLPLDIPTLNSAREIGWSPQAPWDGRFSFNIQALGGTAQFFDDVSELYVEYTSKVFTGIVNSGSIYRVASSRADICPLCGDESLREEWHWDPRRRRMECSRHTPDMEDEPSRTSGSYPLLGED